MQKVILNGGGEQEVRKEEKDWEVIYLLRVCLIGEGTLVIVGFH